MENNTAKELANIIYDTLFENTQHKQFSELDTWIEEQSIDNNTDTITVQLDKKLYHIIIKQVK